MTNPISTVAARALGGITKSAPYNWATKKVNRKTIESAIAYTTIGSIALKDTVGCGMYVYQSVNNDKIPAKRRKFVAALDLTNGALMIFSQVVMFFAMRKLNDKLFPKIFPSFEKTGKVMGQNIRRFRAEAKASGKEVKDKAELREAYLGMRDVAYSLFKSVTELVAATILAKRVIVPFVATPLASKVEKYMGKFSSHGDDGEGNVGESNAQPSMQGKLDVVSSGNDMASNVTESTNLLDKFKNNK